MLNFYYHPLSPISRRVWVCLLEKEIAFESTTIQLQHKEQFQPEFLAINPFHHVPAIVDGDVRLIESIAILDYLDRVYPQPAMIPATAAAIGKMRMIQMVTTNEIMTTFVPVITHQGQIPAEHPKAATLSAGLAFMESELGDGDYFGGKTIDLADCVAGVTLSLLRRLDVDYRPYPRLDAWLDRLAARSSWQQTEPTTTDFDRWRRYIDLTIQRANR
jgi:glutathione S-transferase